MTAPTENFTSHSASTPSVEGAPELRSIATTRAAMEADTPRLDAAARRAADTLDVDALFSAAWAEGGRSTLAGGSAGARVGGDAATAESSGLARLQARAAASSARAADVATNFVGIAVDDDADALAAAVRVLSDRGLADLDKSTVAASVLCVEAGGGEGALDATRVSEGIKALYAGTVTELVAKHALTLHGAELHADGGDAALPSAAAESLAAMLCTADIGDVWAAFLRKRRADLAAAVPWVRGRARGGDAAAVEAALRAPAAAVGRVELQALGARIARLAEADAQWLACDLAEEDRGLHFARLGKEPLALVAEMYGSCYSSALVSRLQALGSPGNGRAGVAARRTDESGAPLPGSVGEGSSAGERSSGASSSALLLNEMEATKQEADSLCERILSALQYTRGTQGVGPSSLSLGTRDGLPFSFATHASAAQQGLVAYCVQSVERALSAEARLLWSARADPVPRAGSPRRGNEKDGGGGHWPHATRGVMTYQLPCTRLAGRHILQRLRCRRLLLGVARHSGSGAAVSSEAAASDAADVKARAAVHMSRPFMLSGSDVTQHGALVLESGLHIADTIARVGNLCAMDAAGGRARSVFAAVAVGMLPVLRKWLQRLATLTSERADVDRVGDRSEVQVLPTSDDDESGSERDRRRRRRAREKGADASGKAGSTATPVAVTMLDRLAALHSVMLLRDCWASAAEGAGIHEKTVDDDVSADVSRGVQRVEMVAHILGQAESSMRRGVHWAAARQLQRTAVLASLAAAKWQYHKPFFNGKRPSHGVRMWLVDLRSTLHDFELGCGHLLRNIEGRSVAERGDDPLGVAIFVSHAACVFSTVFETRLLDISNFYLALHPSRARMDTYRLDVTCIVAASASILPALDDPACAGAAERIRSMCERLVTTMALVAGPWKDVADCFRRLAGDVTGGAASSAGGGGGGGGGEASAHGDDRHVAATTPAGEALRMFCRRLGLHTDAETLETPVGTRNSSDAFDPIAASQKFGASLDSLREAKSALEWDVALGRVGTGGSVSVDEAIALVRKRHELSDWDYPKLAEWEVDARDTLAALVDEVSGDAARRRDDERAREEGPA